MSRKIILLVLEARKYTGWPNKNETEAIALRKIIFRKNAKTGRFFLKGDRFWHKFNNFVSKRLSGGCISSKILNGKRGCVAHIGKPF